MRRVLAALAVIVVLATGARAEELTLSVAVSLKEAVRNSGGASWPLAPA